jgi:hypothetical protein
MAVTHALEAGRRLEIPVAPSQSDFRLTLASGDPVPAAEQLAKTTLYLTHNTGNVIALRVGGRWAPASSAEVSLSLAPLPANTVHDIFAFWTGTAVSLEALAWASATARATALARQDGVWTKSGDPSRRWVGTISTTATAGQCEDSLVKRYVWNAQHRVPRPVRRIDPAASWTYTTAAWRQANANVANEVGIAIGLLIEPIEALIVSTAQHSTTAGGMYVGIGEDSTTAPIAGSVSQCTTSTGGNVPYQVLTAAFRGLPTSIGRHRYVWLENLSSAGTVTFQGASNPSGLVGTVWA